MVKNSSKCSERDVVSRLCELDTLHFPKKEMVDPVTLQCSMKQFQGLSYKAFVSCRTQSVCLKLRSGKSDVQISLACELGKTFKRCQGNSEKETGPTEFSKFVKTVYELAKMDGMGLRHLHGPWQGWTFYFIHTPTPVFYFVVRDTPLASILLFHKYVV